MEDNNDKPNRFKQFREKLNSDPNASFFAGAAVGVASLLLANHLVPCRIHITKDMLQDWTNDPTLQLAARSKTSGAIRVLVLPDAE